MTRNERDELLVGLAIDWSCFDPGEPRAAFHLFKRADPRVGFDLYLDDDRLQCLDRKR